jgi:hypothetical protein
MVHGDQRGDQNTLKGGNEELIGDTDSWGVESTYEPKDSTEDPRNGQ